MSETGSDFGTADLFKLVCHLFPDTDDGELDPSPLPSHEEAEASPCGPHTCIFSHEA